MAQGRESIVAGRIVRLSESVSRVTAPNPGVMTGPGTNTYIVGGAELALIDPGPAIDSHLAVLREAVGDRLRWILCTHTHLDHSPGTEALRSGTGAQVLGMTAPNDGRQDLTFRPNRVLREGESVEFGGCTLRAVHTPGHASNHLCYLLEQQKWLFTGDHIMQGSTVVIAPPDGDMIAYLDSLERLLQIDLALLAPGHGHPIDKPHQEVRRLVAHRLKREQKVLDAFKGRDSATLDELLPLAYDDVPQGIHPVARRSLHAHLIKLAREGRAAEEGDRWRLLKTGDR